MPAKSVFEQNVKVFPSLHFSEDPLPIGYFINALYPNTAFRVRAATQESGYTLEVLIPADNATLDISAVGKAITVSLASVASVASTTAAQLVAALNDPVTYPALSGLIVDAHLVNYTGVNDGSGLFVGGFFVGFYDEKLEGLSVDHTGFNEALVVVDCWHVDFGATVKLSLQHSHDDSTWVDLQADLLTLTSDSEVSYTGLLRFNDGVTTFRQYLRFKAVIEGASDERGVAQVSVVFLLAGRGYFDAEGAQGMAFVL